MSVNDPLPWIAAEVGPRATDPFGRSRARGVSRFAAHRQGGRRRRRTGPGVRDRFHEVELTDAGHADPVLQALPRRLSVLQWHGEYFHDIPEQPLARSSRYPMQAFRVANAYGLLFHPKRRSTRRRDV